MAGCMIADGATQVMGSGQTAMVPVSEGVVDVPLRRKRSS